MDYQNLYDFSARDPEAFWLEAAEAVEWFRAPTRAFDRQSGSYGRWFADGVCNNCHNAVDRHVRDGRGAQDAIIYASPLTGETRHISYRQLLDEVVALSAVLAGFGVGAGDRVLLYMPMIPEAVYAMLACARIGAVHSVVFGGFAAAELATRIDDARPRVILTASCGLEPARAIAYKPLLDEALDRASHKDAVCLVLQREQLAAQLHPDRDHDWQARVDAARAARIDVPCAALSALDPLYILYTSGTTGRPKGVVRDNGGHLVALQWTMSNIYGVKAGEVFWAASDIGWVVGHSYIVYAPLIAGLTTILYEGKPVGTPDASAFARVIGEHRVAALFTAPTALRAIRREDPDAALWKEHAGDSLRRIFLAGERADMATLNWCSDKVGIPAIDHWWQTETGWPIAATPASSDIVPLKSGSAGLPMPGYRVAILDGDGQPMVAGEPGSIAVELPLPPGALPGLWQDDERFERDYLGRFPGYYDTFDRGYLDEDGCLFVLGRTDDVINVAGHRFSTGVFEEIIAGHPEVAECAVIGVPDALKGEKPCAFVVPRNPAHDAAQLSGEVVGRVRAEFGAVGALKDVFIVRRLPKTRSGKLVRGVIRAIMCGEEWTMPPTIEDPAALDEIVALRSFDAAKADGYAI